jgi:hypothetical protein
MLVNDSDRWALRTFNPGDIVRVGPSYRGQGKFAPDGCEGIYTVKRELAPNGCGTGDYYLVRGQVSLAELDACKWDLICHFTRLTALCVEHAREPNGNACIRCGRAQ